MLLHGRAGLTAGHRRLSVGNRMDHGDGSSQTGSHTERDDMFIPTYVVTMHVEYRCRIGIKDAFVCTRSPSISITL